MSGQVGGEVVVPEEDGKEGLSRLNTLDDPDTESTAPKKTFALKASRWEGNIDSVLKVGIRCSQILALLSVWTFLGYLIFSPARVQTPLELVRLIIGSGQGFTVPAILLLLVGPKIVRILRNGDSKSNDHQGID